MTIGVLGLGIIGSVWARHYHEAGVLRSCWNRTPQPDFPGFQRTPADAAALADVIQIVVADPAAVREVLQQIRPTLGPGKIVVQSSTIDPKSSDEFLQTVTSAGARYLEAPFTGSKPAAEQKQSVFYLGGDRQLIIELEPLLARVSSNRLIVGTHVQAATLKLAMNLNIAAHLEGLVEALSLARRAGISDDIFFDMLSKNASYSAVAKLKEPKLRSADFSPQFSVKHLLKDLRLASSINGCEDFPLLDTLRDRFAQADRAGLGDEDFSAVIKLLDDPR